MRKPVRYLVKGPDGEALVVPSLEDLVRLYEAGFVGDEDLVKQESATVWTRAGHMGALHGVRERKRDPRRMGLLLIALVVLAAALGLLLAR
ncbi:MAG: hypothetical protein U0229_01530 [Anaeromyxobacter sp.]